MQFQSANGLHILNFNRGEGNRTSPSSPGMCAPGDQLCPHCQWCMQEMPGASLGVPTGWEQSPETCASWAWVWGRVEAAGGR